MLTKEHIDDLTKEHIDDLLDRVGNILSADGDKIRSIGQIPVEGARLDTETVTVEVIVDEQVGKERMGAHGVDGARRR